MRTTNVKYYFKRTCVLSETIMKHTVWCSTDVHIFYLSTINMQWPANACVHLALCNVRPVKARKWLKRTYALKLESLPDRSHLGYSTKIVKLET